MTEQTTHFGNQTVAVEAKAGMVRSVFNSVASRYDLMNDAMSGGLHRWWKREFVRQIPLYADMHHLDLAGGTGDIAFRLRTRLKEAHREGQITICDINHAMLHEGTKRAIDENHGDMLRWVCGDGETLPLSDHSVDSCTIAFGIRNVTTIPNALHDIHRVLKPGGLFLCLEFSTVQHPILRRVYDEYSEHLIPRMGQVLAGDRAPYDYLVQSIRNFPAPEKFEQMLGEAGFNRTSHQLLTGGVVAIHKGWKI